MKKENLKKGKRGTKLLLKKGDGNSSGITLIALVITMITPYDKLQSR